MNLTSVPRGYILKRRFWIRIRRFSQNTLELKYGGSEYVRSLVIGLHIVLGNFRLDLVFLMLFCPFLNDFWMNYCQRLEPKWLAPGARCPPPLPPPPRVSKPRPIKRSTHQSQNRELLGGVMQARLCIPMRQTRWQTHIMGPHDHPMGHSTIPIIITAITLKLRA